MANYEQKIFEQVIDSYFGESQSSLRLEDEVSLNGVHFKIKDSPIEVKDDNQSSKKPSDSHKKKRESKSKAVLIEAEYHENLPQGWKKVVVQRTTGATAGKYDVYFFTPSGRKLRSKNEIKDYSEKHQLNLDLANFGFSRPRREKPISKPSKKNKAKGISAPVENESNSVSIDMSDSNSNINDSLSNNICDDTFHSSNGDGCISVDNLLNNFDEDIKSLSEAFESPAELDLPNTSFTKSTPPPQEPVTSGESVEFDIDQSHLGRTFKIERPLSFSCF